MPNDLSTSDILTVLAERRRRLLLRLLRDARTPLPVTELAERIGEYESGGPESSDPLSIRLRLRHAHLPKLEAAAVVEFDEGKGTVRPARNFDVLVRFLEKVEAGERSRSDR
ncbi:DUF7344 domain-containing protein [Halorubrum lipolyticum]|uniref:DUF7344 domain-containing protein n=1 Tax=Halorubrum lipolyticum DSM 21995 TaxID=1227482 RepID=M0NL27_9EURY|nr:hypothetical protein [Halorubrum lipolyticum]EMA58288.1 hypothetical protein C469_13800 [Halorubrum lipolyticum DSM 21995]